MKTYIKQMSVLFLALAASLLLLDAHAGKPVKVTVTAADPASALQGELKVVEIEGTGFDAGSTARFIVTDTRDDTQIDVNKVTFNAATGKLKAEIKVKDAALPVEYDIEVMTSSGRRGKGTTLFQVREKAGQEDPCVVLTSYFPAFIYTVTTSPKNPRKGGFDLYVSSADGACRVLVYSGDYVWGGNVSFRYFDQGNGSGKGMAVWKQKRDGYEKTDISQLIRMIEFNVENHMIVDSLPLTSEIIYMAPPALPGWYIAKPALSPSGDKIMFPGHENYDYHYLSEIDLFDCTVPPCVNRIFNFGVDEFHGNTLAFGLTSDSIYSRYLNYDLTESQYVVRLTKQEGEWINQPEFIAEYLEQVRRLSVGLWDWRELGNAEEVIAVSHGDLDDPTLEIDVWGCLSENEEPCLLIEGLPGSQASFNSAGGNPVLLYEIESSHGWEIHKYDLTNSEASLLIEAINSGESSWISGIDGAD